MEPIVIQLQRVAIDNSTSISDLLLKAKLVASKLGLSDAMKWIELELHGYIYTDENDVPDFRIVSGLVTAIDPYRGRIPVVLPDDPDVRKAMNSTRVSQSAIELENMAKSNKSFVVIYSGEKRTAINRLYGIEAAQYNLEICGASLRRIVDLVRDKILSWALELETLGIVGTGLTFSDEEKAVANGAETHYHIDKIENFSGNMGNLYDSAKVVATQTIGFDKDAIKILVSQIVDNKDRLGLDAQKGSHLDGALAGIQEELAKPQPNRSKIVEGLKSIRNICEGAVGSIVATGILASIDKISLPLLGP